MSNDIIIDLEANKIIDNERFIIIDSFIADTINILNKKGYKTKYSCSGHYYEPRKLLFRCYNIDLLEEIKKDSLCEIVEFNENDFTYWDEREITQIYIMFEGIYEFKNMPEGFILEDGNLISHQIEFFDKENKRKKPNEIMDEIKKYNEILKNWASNLPKIN